MKKLAKTKGRVLYLHQYYATPSSNGGIRSYLISKALVEKGYDVEIVTSSAFVPNSWELQPGWNVKYVEGVTVNILRLPYSNKTGFLKRIWLFIMFSVRATLKSLFINCDVVFASSTPLTISIPGVIASRWHGAPLVFEVRDLWPDVPIAMGVLRSKVLILVAKILEKWAYRNAAKIVALSPGMADGVLEVGYGSTIIPNVSDVDFFDVDDSEGEKFRTQHSWAQRKKLVVYTGTFGKVNNLMYMVEVAQAMLDLDPLVCFVLVGDGAEAQMLKGAAIKKGLLAKNLYFLPPVGKNELPAILSAASVCVSTVLPIPELWNNSANKFFDALAAGKPIAINHYGWQAEILHNNHVGVVMEPQSPKKGAEALFKAMSSDDWLLNAQTEALHLAHNVYNVKRLTDSVEKVIASTLSNN